MKHDTILPKLANMLDYNPDTGSVTWAVSPYKRIPKGSDAGYTRPDQHRVITYKGFVVPVAKVIWFMKTGLVAEHVIHQDHDKSNFQFDNLLSVNSTHARMHRRAHKDNVSGFKGVSFCKDRNMFRARATVKGQLYEFGYHQTAQAAAQSRTDGLRSITL